MTAILLATVGALIVYTWVRGVGWHHDNEEIVALAPIPAGVAAGFVYATGTLLPAFLVGGVPLPHLFLQTLTTIAVIIGVPFMFVVGEAFLDAERSDDRFEPRLLTRGDWLR